MRFLLQVSTFKLWLKPRVGGDQNNAEVTQDEAQLDLKHNECRRARISQGYKAKEPSHTCLRQYKYKIVAMTGLHKHATYK